MGGSYLNHIISLRRFKSTNSRFLRAPRNTLVLSGTKLLVSRFELVPKLRVILRLVILSVLVLRAMPALVATALALLATQACRNIAKAASLHTMPDIATRAKRTGATLYIIVPLRILLSKSLKVWSPNMLPH